MKEYYQKRYLCKDWDTLSERVVKNILNNEENNEPYLEIIKHKAFIPAGNTLTTGVKPLTPNCSILGTLTEENFDTMLELSKFLWNQSTGIGFDLSGLKDPVEKLRILSIANDLIDLKHRPKRGNMAVLNINHPQIKEFICCKTTTTTDLYNFNISVTIDEEVLDENIFNLIAKQAWMTGDPGLIFLKNAKTYGPDFAEELGQITTCVPCGEQFMHTFETCNLGSINLNSNYLMEKGSLDFQKLSKTIEISIEFMDKIIDKLEFPDQYMKKVSLQTRRIGLGVMGWADYLQRIGLKYDSSEALNLAEMLSKFITDCSLKKSASLAEKYGCHKYSKIYRNISLTCIAPTGGITGLTENKGYGIEPFFNEALKFNYKVHINMQAAWQCGIQNAVSKTINLPSNTTVEDVMNAFKYAMKMKVKGITIYRDGSKLFQPISLDMLCNECLE